MPQSELVFQMVAGTSQVKVCSNALNSLLRVGQLGRPGRSACGGPQKGSIQNSAACGGLKKRSVNKIRRLRRVVFGIQHPDRFQQFLTGPPTACHTIGWQAFITNVRSGALANVSIQEQCNPKERDPEAPWSHPFSMAYLGPSGTGAYGIALSLASLVAQRAHLCVLVGSPSPCHRCCRCGCGRCCCCRCFCCCCCCCSCLFFVFGIGFGVVVIIVMGPHVAIVVVVFDCSCVCVWLALVFALALWLRLWRIWWLWWLSRLWLLSFLWP